MSTNTEIDPQLASQLASMLDQPARDLQKAASARATFLAQAQEMKDSNPATVSPAGELRHNRWMHAIQSFLTVFEKKEHSPMLGTLGTVLLIVSLVLGGGGITVAAAQDSLPDQALYPVKTWSEDVRLGMTVNEQSQLQLALQLSNRRAEEIMAMIRSGQTPPEAVQERMQSQIEMALQLAAGLPDQSSVPALKRIQAQLQVQERAFAQLGTPSDPQANAALQRTRTMLQEHLQLCADGIVDPAFLREQLRERSRTKYGETMPAPMQQQTQSGVGNPWTTGTPTPGSGYGPGPGDGNGGNNPWTTGTPTPGSGYGPGPGDCSGCTITPGPNQPGNSGGGSDNGGGSDVGGGSDAGGGSGTGGDGGGSGTGGDGGGSGTGGDGGGSGTGGDGGGSGTGGGGGGK